MDYLRWCTLAVFFALAASCGDDAPESTPDASDAKPDASDAKPDASETKPDASHDVPDASDTKKCPESGEPAVAGCPCKKPRGSYCCGVGYGMSCGKDMIWNPFEDSPCTPNDEDAGPMIECRR